MAGREARSDSWPALTRDILKLHFYPAFVSLDDLQIMTSILHRFEEEDEDEAIAMGRSSPPPEARVPKPPSSRGRSRPAARTAAETWRATAEEKAEVDEKHWESARVLAYVADRSASFGKCRTVSR